MLTLISCDIPSRFEGSAEAAFVEGTVEGFLLVNPDWESLVFIAEDAVSVHTLKVAFGGVVVAREGDLRYLVFELLQDLLVRDIALLVVLMNHKTSPVADSIDAFWHQCSAGSIVRAHVAVYAFPAGIAVTSWPVSRRTFVAQRQRPAERIRTVLTPPPWRTYTPAI